MMAIMIALVIWVTMMTAVMMTIARADYETSGEMCLIRPRYQIRAS